MLSIPTPFPCPGSTALFQGVRWRIQQYVGDQALISREGENATGCRRVPATDLVDPQAAADHDAIALGDIRESTARIAIYAAGLLRHVDEVALRDLGLRLKEAAQEGRIPRYRDNSHLVRIMRRLGWRKDGYAGAGHDRSPVYRRVATPVKEG